MDIALTVALIIMMSKGMNTVQDTGRMERENQNNIAAMQEYRKWNAWDEKVLYSQDIVSAILEFRGDPEIVINKQNSQDKYAYTDNTNSPNYIKSYTKSNTTDSDISQIYLDFADSTIKYISRLHRDENGEVDKIFFIRQDK